MFENDVKMYGTQAWYNSLESFAPFENDVKMYGTQAGKGVEPVHGGLRMM